MFESLPPSYLSRIVDHQLVDNLAAEVFVVTGFSENDLAIMAEGFRKQNCSVEWDLDKTTLFVRPALKSKRTHPFRAAEESAAEGSDEKLEGSHEQIDSGTTEGGR